VIISPLATIYNQRMSATKFTVKSKKHIECHIPVIGKGASPEYLHESGNGLGFCHAEELAQSSDGVSTWSDGFSYSVYPQFAINATAVPEPGIFGLLALGGLSFGLRRLN
jgi:hypothetical protein